MSNDPSEKKIVRGVWDCKCCKRTRIGPEQMSCPSCGKPRDKDTKFYMITDQKSTYVTGAEKQRALSGPDWECRFCGSLNSATLNDCKNCGASRTADCKDYFKIKAEQQKEAVPSASETHVHDIAQPKDDNPEPEPKPEPVITPDPVPEPEPVPEVIPERDPEPVQYTPTSNDVEENVPTFLDIIKKILRGIVDFFEYNAQEIITGTFVIAGIVGVVLLCVWLFRPHYKTVKVDHTYWDYSIEVEQIRTVSENSWTLPDGAKNVTTKSEIYTHKKVFDHNETKSRQVKKDRIARYETKVTGYKDLGNGYFEEITERVPVYETYYETEYYTEPVYHNEPVYRNKYYYDIDRWFYYRTLTESGIDSAVKLPDTSGLKEDERTGAHESTYSFNGTDDEGVTETYDVSYSEWENLESGDLVTVEYNKAGIILSIKEQE